MIEYPIGISGQCLILTQLVLDHFRRFRQTRFWHREAGGQLFAHYDRGRIVVEVATGPRKGDRRTRWSYIPDRAAEQLEIETFHQKGLLFIGNWHTHPQRVPVPSSIDIESISEAVNLSNHALNGFVLVVVGQNDAPEGLYVGACDGTAVYRLSPRGGAITAIRAATNTWDKQEASH